MSNWISEFTDRAKHALDEKAKESGTERGSSTYVSNIKEVPSPRDEKAKQSEVKKK